MARTMAGSTCVMLAIEGITRIVAIIATATIADSTAAVLVRKPAETANASTPQAMTHA